MNALNQEISLKLLQGVTELSERVIRETNQLSPLLFYCMKDEYFSVTIQNEENELTNIISEYVLNNNISNYIYSEIIGMDFDVIKYSMVINNVQFENLYIGFRKFENQINFSDLMSFEDVQFWLNN